MEQSRCRVSPKALNNNFPTTISETISVGVLKNIKVWVVEDVNVYRYDGSNLNGNPRYDNGQFTYLGNYTIAKRQGSSTMFYVYTGPAGETNAS